MADVHAGRADLSEYRAWKNMKSRCKLTSHPQYKDYGGRGIKVCDRWNNYKNFFEDMGFKPSSKLTLERINNDGNYELSNCRWSTWKEQANNRRCYPSTRVRPIKEGVTGTTKLRNKWQAQINIDGKHKYLGTFSSRHEAHMVYMKNLAQLI